MFLFHEILGVVLFLLWMGRCREVICFCAYWENSSLSSTDLVFFISQGRITGPVRWHKFLIIRVTSCAYFISERQENLRVKWCWNLHLIATKHFGRKSTNLKIWVTVIIYIKMLHFTRCSWVLRFLILIKLRVLLFVFLTFFLKKKN